MNRNRRSFLQGLATAGATAATSALPVQAKGPIGAPDDAVGMLYDTTLCIGCKSCVVACNEANELPPDTRRDELYQAPMSLNDQTKNIIKLYKDGDRRSYMKQQCMHCLDPGCATACMIGSYQKREYGIVTWDPDKCIGCRYCQLACPYEIPKFEWDDTTPRLVKCEMCNHLIAKGQQPACCEVCPRGAVIYGKYTDLLEEAHRRLEDNPGRYVDHVYGEKEAGGSQVLYLSHVPFEMLGLPPLDEESAGKLTRSVQHGIYKGFIAPVALYAILGTVMLRNRRLDRAEQQEQPQSGDEE
ncbi:hydrogenase 2 operon protein HybA [bacterium]|nr:hydrogenase 2 operon protein HybA [bacterium]